MMRKVEEALQVTLAKLLNGFKSITLKKQAYVKQTVSQSSLF